MSDITLPPRRRIRLAAVLGALVVVAAALLPTAPAVAVTGAPAATGTGWLRVAHLSPDTKAVDVRLTSVSGGSVAYQLDNVSYGGVSPYTTLAAGFYTISMVPTGGNPAAPMITSSVEVTPGRTATVAAYGTNANLSVKVFSDDLTAPAPNNARIRLIQASTVAASVDVSTSTGAPIAQGAAAGTATAYAQVAAGPWTLDLTSASANGTASVDLASGSITTLFVLDNSTGGLTVLPVLDSAATAATPVGGVQTGGGYLATHGTHGPQPWDGLTGRGDAEPLS